MKSANVICVILTLLPALLFGNGDSGTTGFDFLRTDTGARPSAVGGAFTAATGDLHALVYNPAGLVGVPHKQGTFTFADQLLDISSGFAGFSWQFENAGILAVGIGYTSYGDFRRTDITGQDLGSFSSGDVMFSVGYADSLDFGLRWGGTVKYIHSKIDDYTAAAVAVDLGVVYRFHKDKWNIGLGIRNLGAAVDAFIEEMEDLPTAYTLGFSKRLAHLPLLLNFDLIRHHHSESENLGGFYWALGGEFTITEHFFLRGGYNSRGQEEKVNQNSGNFAGVTLGFGLRIRTFRIDYNYSTFGVLGSMNRFTVTAGF